MRDRIIQACCVLTYTWMLAAYSIPLVALSRHPTKAMIAVLVVSAVIGAVVGGITEKDWRRA